MEEFSEAYWDNRFKNQDIGWDLGVVSPPLKAYIDQLKNKNLNILIPGAGNAYEAEYLFHNGFQNVFVIDLSITAIQNFQDKVPDFPSKHLIHGDFFKLKGNYDLILEQAFFCALDPILRLAYVEQMTDLLSEKGKLVGLLFNQALYTEHPPFGGHKRDYLNTFKPLFHIDVMEDCYNSIEKRKGKELFIVLRKKSKVQFP